MLRYLIIFAIVMYGGVVAVTDGLILEFMLAGATIKPAAAIFFAISMAAPLVAFLVWAVWRGLKRGGSGAGEGEGPEGQ